MSSSEVRARAAANQPGEAKGAVGLEFRKANAPGPASPHPGEPLILPDLPLPPWHVRNSRKLMIAALLVAAAGLAFGYVYLRRDFGPSPLDGIKLDATTLGAPASAPEVPKSARAIGAIAPVLKADPPPQAPLRANPVAAAQPQITTQPHVTTQPHITTQSHVTHTKSTVTAPVAPAPDVQQKVAAPRAGVREDQPGSGACTEAVAALGLCSPNARVEGK